MRFAAVWAFIGLAAFSYTADGAEPKALQDLRTYRSFDLKHADVQRCKTLMRELLEDAEKTGKYEELARSFSEVLEEGNHFRAHDDYVLWMGGRLLQAYPPTLEALRAVAVKVDNADRLAADEGIQRELEMLGAELVTRWVESAPDVFRRSAGFSLVDQEKWSGLRKQLARTSYEYDAKKEKHVATGTEVSYLVTTILYCGHPGG